MAHKKSIPRKTSSKKTTRSSKSKKIKFGTNLRRATLIIYVLVFANIGALTLVFTHATVTGHSNSVEIDQFNRINNHRASHRKSELTRSGCITNYARVWAKHMSDTNNLSHSNFGSQIPAYCGSGWTVLGENVGRSGVGPEGIMASSASVFQSYLDSPGHHANIEANYNLVGLAGYQNGNNLWTVQIYAQCSGCSNKWTSAPTYAGEPSAPAPPPASRNENDQINSTYGDFNGDGYDDIFWYGPGGSGDSIWYGTSSQGKFTNYTNISVNGTDYIPLIGDFNGDGRSDIFFYAPGGSADYLWYGNSSFGSFTKTSSINVNGSYYPLVGDFNGDGQDDVFWYAPGRAADFMWYFNSSHNSFSSHSVAVSGNYVPVPGDFNGDGRGDVFWYAPGRTADYIWYFNSSKTSYTSVQKSVNSSAYKPVPGDFNGDGRGDVFWYAPGSTGDYIWYGNSSRGSFKSVQKNINGIYNGIPGDFNGDGQADIFWYGPTGADYMWYGNSSYGSFNDFSDVNVSGSNYLPSP